MKKYSLLLLLAVGSFSLVSAQHDSSDQEKIHQDLKEGLAEMRKSIEKLELPELELKEMIQEIEKVMPTQEQINSTKEIIAGAIEEIEKIDLKPLLGILEDLGSVFDTRII